MRRRAGSKGQDRHEGSHGDRHALGREALAHAPSQPLFRVVFWMCSHYDAPGKHVGLGLFKSWDCESDANLVRSEVGTIPDESIFLKIAEENLSPFDQLLLPCVHRLQRKAFPHRETGRKEDRGFYFDIKMTVRDAHAYLELLMDQ